MSALPSGYLRRVSSSVLDDLKISFMTGLTEVTPGSVSLFGLQADANTEIVPRTNARFMGSGVIYPILIEIPKKARN